MMRLVISVLRRCRSFRQGTKGSAAVEFAILGTAFLLLTGGVMDLSHAWYMTNVMANASREGARYGTRYWTNAGGRILPRNLVPTIQNYILNSSSDNGGQGGWGLNQLLPADANPQVTLRGPGATETDPGALTSEDLTVTITARKNWFLLGALVPGLGSFKDLSVTTTMKCE